MSNQQGIPRALVLKMALLTEGTFVAATLLWYWITEAQLPLQISAPLAILGLLSALPIFTLNFSIFAILANLRPGYHHFRAFKEGVVRPLCANLDPVSALLVALSSGIGEELFFRGVMEHELRAHVGTVLALVITNLVFSYVHFIGIFSRFYRLGLLYFLCGVYFSYLVLLSGSLLPAIIAHSFYNFMAMVYMRYSRRTVES